MIIINTQQYSDIKIRLLVVTISIFAAVLIGMLVFTYIFFINVFNENIEEKAENVYNYVLKEINYDVFNYPQNKGEEMDAVFENEEIFKDVDELLGVRDIYTIEKSGNGSILYTSRYVSGTTVVSYFSEGKLLDKELSVYAKRALEGEMVSSDSDVDIYGKPSYVYMYPVYNETTELIGVIGFVFNAEDVVATQGLLVKILVIAVLIALAALYKVVHVILNNFIYRIVSAILYTDNLTGLKNRLGYEEKIEQINLKIKNNLSKEYNMHIVMYDLNNLKKVNDTLGHLAGDKYILDSSVIIDQCFRNIGTTYRIGGDEFVTIVEGVRTEDVEKAIERLIAEENAYNLRNESSAIRVSISYGFASFRLGEDLNTSSIVKRADERMYKLKRTKKLASK